jgi:hypothetical protein
MRLIGILFVLGILLANAAFAADCGKGCGKDKCAKRHARVAACCDKHAQDGGSCIDIPVPPQDCTLLDPNCYPHEPFRLICNYNRAEYQLCCGHADYELLCRPRCPQQPCKTKCKAKCKRACEPVILNSAGDLD